MAKIYVASSWRNLFQPAVVQTLKSYGHEVYDFRNPPKRSGFAWSDINDNWQSWSTKEFVAALKHPIAKAGFSSDFEGMDNADICVMVLPCGRSANAEAGWMKGKGKKVFVYSPIRQEPELMYRLFDGITDDIQELEGMIEGRDKRCGDCDAFCECGLTGIKANEIACEYFDDESMSRLKK